MGLTVRFHKALWKGCYFGIEDSHKFAPTIQCHTTLEGREWGVRGRKICVPKIGPEKLLLKIGF